MPFLCQTILCEVEVPSPKPENRHEQCSNLEGIGRLQEGVEQNGTIPPSHRRGTDGDCNYCAQEEAQETANTLTPGKSDAWVLKEIRHNHGKTDFPNGRARLGLHVRELIICWSSDSFDSD